MNWSKITSLIFLLFTTAGTARAQFSPGPLSKVHQDYEGVTNCLKCHNFGSSDLARNCLECHQPIKLRLSEKRGYHGLLEDRTCSKCHKEHAGRNNALVEWKPSKEKFDHSKTGYKLTGKHESLKCDACHKPEGVQQADVKSYAETYPKAGVLQKTYLGLSTGCASCHIKVHRGEFKDQTCDKCHGTRDWKQVLKTFNHTRQTRYPLLGAHIKTDCEKCHATYQPKTGAYQVHVFGGLKFNGCLACHADYHHGQFDKNCLKCHTLDTFKNPNSTVVDHSKTRFPLLGKHQSVKCLDCHKSGKSSAPLKFAACTGCHQDYHKHAFDYRQAGPKCDDCHHEQGFTPPLFTLEQHQKTNFPLTGAHLALPCIQCHRDAEKNSTYHWPSDGCQTCHNNPHGSQFDAYHSGEIWCETCHTTVTWSTLKFDHAKTKLPLQGKHNRIACGDCHKPRHRIVQYRGLDFTCESCHKDLHESQFTLLDGTNPCQKCHDFESWRIPNFDHERLTRFSLVGQHEKVVCEKCHFIQRIKPRQPPTVRFAPLAHECSDCHKIGP